MKRCESCAQENPDEAVFCQQCGTRFSEPASPITTTTESEEDRLVRAFIGPNADRYLDQFRKFSKEGVPRFALTWHWPAFLFDPFLWFLYRKMYLYAFVYAIGPVLSAYITGDLTVGIVWRIVAGASANYIYYWQVKEHVAEIRRSATAEPARIERLLKDMGGVQPYVLWLGIGLHMILVAFLMMAILKGPSEGDETRPGRSLPFPQRNSF
jgi:Protein of unknown function (DUF2628)